MMKSKNVIAVCYGILILITVVGCQNNETFNSEKWKANEVDWQLDDKREKMVNDLISSDTIIGLNKDDIISLLGDPESINETKMKYLIREKHTWNVDPDYIKYLLIDLDENSNAINCYVEETK